MTDTLQSGAESALDLDKLEALLLAATPDDWKAKRQGVIVGGPFRQYANGSAQSQIAAFSVTFHPDAPDDEPERQQANTDFCVAAKNAMPALIALARRATAPAPTESETGDAFMVVGRAGNRRADLEAVLRDALANPVATDGDEALQLARRAAADKGGAQLITRLMTEINDLRAAPVLPAVGGALVASDEQKDQLSVMPPFAAPASQRDALYMAAINCQHAIMDDVVKLYRDHKKPGNALSQLADRLEAELASRGRAQGGITQANSAAGAQPTGNAGQGEQS